ncbi:uncharacterized protein [Lolium perenne]|uniref:uncharacterized protein n=1 Tax=Lolium perenne TaxID=4522 RepID=UPI0021EA04A7|nr:uncharacterized protein LOC127332168 [Lolium perenne]
MQSPALEPRTSMAEQYKKRPRLSDNAESSASKKPSILEVTSPVATLAPAPAPASVSPSPVATRTPSLAAPSPVSKRAPSSAAPSPAAMSKPIAVVKPTAATVKVTNPVPAMASALEAPNPVASSTPTSALPSPAAPNTADTATLAPSPVATAKPAVKHEPEDGRMLAVPAAEEVVILEVEKKWLYCVTCHSPLKPPIFLCEVGHAVCCDCAGRGGERKHCGACNRAATYSHVPWMDGMVTGHKEPCPYKSFGCARSIVYYAAADHKARCAHAPCYCFECAFEGSPASLVRHLTDQSGRHRWPVEEIKYESKKSFVVPASEHRRLLVSEEDGRVFLLAVGAGRGASGVRPVNIVCVRGNAGGGTTRPLYMGVLWVDGPPAASGHLRGDFKLKGELANCGVPGEVDMDHGQLHAHVNPEMLHGESKEVHLAICITKF